MLHADGTGRSQDWVPCRLPHDRGQVGPVLDRKGLACNFAHRRQLSRIADEQHEGIQSLQR